MNVDDTKASRRWIPGTTDAYAMIAVAILALLAGIVIPFYADAMGYKFGRLLALPAFLLLCFILMFNRILLLTLIILFRSAGDLVLSSTQFKIGSYETGIGGIINLCVILLACLLVLEQPSRLSKKMAAAWLPFLLVVLVGVAISPVTGDAIRTYLTLLSYFAMFVCAFYCVRSPRDFRHCVKLVLWSSALPALYSLVDIASNGVAGGRLHSTFAHPNIFAFYLTVVIPLTLYVLKDRTVQLSGSSRIALSLYMIFLMVLLVLTQTRSAWLACVMVFVAYALLFERRYFLYMLLLPVVALTIPEVRDRLLDLGAGTEAVRYAKLNSFAWRVSIWESGLQWMQPGRYLLGYGTEAFMHYSTVFFEDAGGINWGAHSVFVQLIFDAGLTGLLAYLWLHARMVIIFKSLVRIDKLAAFIAISVVCTNLVVSFSDNMFSYLVFNWYLWFFLGAACALVASTSPAVDARHERGARGVGGVGGGRGAPPAVDSRTQPMGHA